MANENDIKGMLCVYTAETDKLLKELMEKNGDLNRIGVFRYPEVQNAPKEQAHVADVLLDLTKKGYNQVVYTHSDHVVNHLARRIVEDGLDDEKVSLVNMVKIFFATKDGDETVIKEIEIDDKKGIVRQPVGFFDQWIEDGDYTMKAAARWIREKK